MASKWIAVFCLIVVAVNCHVLVMPENPGRLPLPLKPERELFGPNPDIFAEEPFDGVAGRRVYRKTHDVPLPPAVAAKKGAKVPDFVPEIEDRFAVRGGNCPTGYVASGGFCFPDYD